MHDDPPPWRVHALDVGHGHVLHVQESGRRDGPALLVLHGGPGSGCSPLLRRFADPAQWRIVCVDQRGAGRSTPRGATAHNTTADLLADLRRLRAALGIGRWVVAGGSWGAALALAHALDAPEAVEALILRAVFVPDAAGIDAFFAGADGRPRFDWRAFGNTPPGEQRRLAGLWWRHEQNLGGLTADTLPDGDAIDALVDRYRVQAHYLRHRCWLDDPPLPQRLSALPALPTLLLHGLADRICPPEGARAIAARLAPHAWVRWIDGAGHDPAHPAMAAATLEALDRYARERCWPDAGEPGANRSRPVMATEPVSGGATR